MTQDEPGGYRADLTQAIGETDADVMLVSVGVMLHGLVIGDWRRVYKGLWCIHQLLRERSHGDLPDYFYERQPK